MSGKGRKGYAAALAAALVVLVVSAGAAIAYFADGGGPDGTAAGQPTASPSWPPSPGTGRQQDGAWMMDGQGYSGMMDHWDDPGYWGHGYWGDGAVTQERARAAADAWLAAVQPGASTGQASRMPMGYVFAVTRDGRAVGSVMVDDGDGHVDWWHGAGTPAPPAG